MTKENQEICFRETVRKIFRNNSKITLNIELLNLGEVEGEHLLNSIIFLNKSGMLGNLNWEYETKSKSYIPKDISDSISDQLKSDDEVIHDAIREDIPMLIRVVKMLRERFSYHQDLAFGVIKMILHNDDVSHLLHWLTFNTNIDGEEIASTVLKEYYANL